MLFKFYGSTVASEKNYCKKKLCIKSDEIKKNGIN